jgi:hypothetical protein
MESASEAAPRNRPRSFRHRPGFALSDFDNANAMARLSIREKLGKTAGSRFPACDFACLRYFMMTLPDVSIKGLRALLFSTGSEVLDGVVQELRVCPDDILMISICCVGNRPGYLDRQRINSSYFNDMAKSTCPQRTEKTPTVSGQTLSTASEFGEVAHALPGFGLISKFGSKIAGKAGHAGRALLQWRADGRGSCDSAPPALRSNPIL